MSQHPNSLGTRFQVDGWGDRFSEWPVGRVRETIASRTLVPLLDSDELVNPRKITVLAPFDVEKERARRADDREFWRKIREEGPQKGSPAWIAQKPFGTRWFYEMFSSR